MSRINRAYNNALTSNVSNRILVGSQWLMIKISSINETTFTDKTWGTSQIAHQLKGGAQVFWTYWAQILKTATLWIVNVAYPYLATERRHRITGIIPLVRVVPSSAETRPRLPY